MEVPGEKRVPVPFRPSQISHGLEWTGIEPDTLRREAGYWLRCCLVGELERYFGSLAAQFSQH